MREFHYPAKTEQKLALGGWHSANALAFLFVLYIFFLILHLPINHFIQSLSKRVINFNFILLSLNIWK